MSERSDLISRLCNERDFRGSYLRAKLNVLISSQIFALRKRFFGTQEAFADANDMKQSRVSAMETPGATNFNLETLIRVAATSKVGLIVKFVPFSEMLRWDNNFVQDEFGVIQIDKDVEFLTPSEEPQAETQQVESPSHSWMQRLNEKNSQHEKVSNRSRLPASPLQIEVQAASKSQLSALELSTSVLAGR